MVPKKNDGEALTIGIDEAGRGPVLGPLVMAGVLVKEEKLDLLKKDGVKDSKLVQPEQREKLFERILAVADDSAVEILEPLTIDAALKSSSLNLNWLEANTAAAIINKLTERKYTEKGNRGERAAGAEKVIGAEKLNRGEKSDKVKVIVDCPSPNIEVYTDYLRARITDKNITLVVEHKADVNHVVVGAASILAKVTRDREIEKLKKKLGIDVGSGYLTDERTQQFLEKHFDDYENVFRKKWLPWQEKLKKKNQATLGGFI